jgi:hypothetical protein
MRSFASSFVSRADSRPQSSDANHRRFTARNETRDPPNLTHIPLPALARPRHKGGAAARPATLDAAAGLFAGARVRSMLARPRRDRGRARRRRNQDAAAGTTEGRRRQPPRRTSGAPPADSRRPDVPLPDSLTPGGRHGRHGA